MVELDYYQLRRVADYLYDGEPRVAHIMSQIRNFKDGDRVLLWLCRNKIRGKKMVDFFSEQNKSDTKRGVMLGVQKALSYIEHGNGYSKPALTTKDLK